jgi:hypothetical protein
VLDILGGGRIIGSAIKNSFTRILCLTVLLCAPPNTISNAIRSGLEDGIRLKNISRKVKDSINAHNRSKK